MADLPVSIIIDNYNYGRFLREAVDSALCQTYPCTEIIVVDDGSTDDSRDIIASYGDRIVPILKANGGQGSAFNAGFAVSRGHIVFFLDADDFLYPHAVAQVVAAYEADRLENDPGKNDPGKNDPGKNDPGKNDPGKNDPNENGSYENRCVKVQFRLRLGDEHSEPMPFTDPRADKAMPNGDVSGELLTRGSYTTPPTSGNAFSRWYLEKILPMPEEPYRQGADGGYLNLLAPLYGPVRSLDEELGLYRHHGANFYAQTASAFDEKWFIVMVSRDVRKEALLRKKAAELGFEIERGPALENYQVQARRLVNLRLNRDEHPAPDDTRLGLFNKSLTAEWRYTSDGFGEKLLVSLWLVGAAWLPLEAAREVIAWRFDAATRPKMVGTLVKRMRKLLPRSYG